MKQTDLAIFLSTLAILISVAVCVAAYDEATSYEMIAIKYVRR